MEHDSNPKHLTHSEVNIKVFLRLLKQRRDTTNSLGSMLKVLWIPDHTNNEKNWKAGGLTRHDCVLDSPLVCIVFVPLVFM